MVTTVSPFRGLSVGSSVLRLLVVVLFLLVDSHAFVTTTRRVLIIPRASATRTRWWAQQEEKAAAAAVASEADTPRRSSNTMKVLKGVRDLVDDFDVFLLDMWGVLHNGSAPYAGVLEAVDRLRQATNKDRNKRLIILSNSSKRVDHSIKMLRKLGFSDDSFAQIITSGEVAYQILGGNSCFASSSTLSWSKLDKVTSKTAVVLGSGDQDEEYLQACGWELTTPDQASLVVARGTFTINDGTNVVDKRVDGDQTYDEVLQQTLQDCAARQLPMLVTNPDKVRPDEGFPPMPGKLGDLYEAALQKASEINGASTLNEDPSNLVYRIGKPFANVYDLALENVEDRSRVCMIGDALETDVTGGTRVGIATVWVLMDGIHSDETVQGVADAPRVLQDFQSQSTGTYAQGIKLVPNYLLSNFQW